MYINEERIKQSHWTAKAVAFLVAVFIAFVGFNLIADNCHFIPSAEAATKNKTFKPGKDAHSNWKKLEKLVEGNKSKVVNIKRGSIFKIDAPLHPGSNTTINATGSTIAITRHHGKIQNLVFPHPKSTKYSAIKNLTLKGGKWRSTEKNGYKGGLIAIAHGTNITLDNIDVNANWSGHAVEIMACKNVTIKNSKIWSIGKLSSTCKEEALQIDLTTKKSTPQVWRYGSKYAKGQTCQNITIQNCYIDGARGLCVSYNDSENGKWLTKYHKNITVKDNVILGRTSEAVALFNTVGANICENVMVSRSTGKTGASKAMGFMAALFGKAPKQEMAKSTLAITGNQVYGNRNAIEVRGYFTQKKPRKSLQRFGQVVVMGNKAYCQTSASNAIFVVHEGRNTEYEARSGDKETISNNEIGKWNNNKVTSSWGGSAISL